MAVHGGTPLGTLKIATSINPDDEFPLIKMFRYPDCVMYNVINPYVCCPAAPVEHPALANAPPAYGPLEATKLNGPATPG